MPPVANAAAMNPNDQLDDLRRRFTLLEGERKANFETAAMSIKQNKEIIGQMRLENDNMKKEIAKLRGEKPVTTEQQLEKSMSEVQGLQRKLDGIRADNKKKGNHLEGLENKLDELSVGSQIHSSEASPEMRQIRVLENRLDKAVIKHNEASSIKRTYEAIVKRLKEERIGFDNQLAAIEHTLKSKERDYEELLLLSHDAYHAKEMAQAELHRFEQGVMDERGQRDREVQEKKALVEQRVTMNRRLETHQKQLQKQADAEKQQERELKELKDATMTQGFSSDIAQEERQKLEDYEEAFHAIKEATGVDDVNEVIQKFLTQEDTHKNLTKLTKENQGTIEELTEKRRKIRLQVEELKFSSGGAANRRQAIDEKETRFGEATEKFERNKGKYERLAKMLIDTKAGIEHLGEKLAPIKLENESTLEMSDETVEDLLQQCELKVSKLLNLTHQMEEDPTDRKRMLDDDKYEERLMLKSQSGVRIKLADKEEDGDDDEDGYEEEMDEDVAHRRQVKYNSDQILLKQQTKNRKKSKKKDAK